MSTARLFLLRTTAASGAAMLALTGLAGVAPAQTGSLDSGLGPGIESLLGPVGEMLPDPGSLDEAVAAARAVAAGSLDPLSPVLDPGAAAGPDSAVLSALGRAAGPAAVPASGAVGGVDGAGAGPGGQGGDGPGAGPEAGAGAELGAGLAAVAALTGVLAGHGSDVADPVALPPLPGPR